MRATRTTRTEERGKQKRHLPTDKNMIPKAPTTTSRNTPPCHARRGLPGAAQPDDPRQEAIGLRRHQASTPPTSARRRGTRTSSRRRQTATGRSACGCATTTSCRRPSSRTRGTTTGRRRRRRTPPPSTRNGRNRHIWSRTSAGDDEAGARAHRRPLVAVPTGDLPDVHDGGEIQRDERADRPVYGTACRASLGAGLPRTGDAARTDHAQGSKRRAIGRTPSASAFISRTSSIRTGATRSASRSCRADRRVSLDEADSGQVLRGEQRASASHDEARRSIGHVEDEGAEHPVPPPQPEPQGGTRRAPC